MKHLRTDSIVRLWDVRKFSSALKSFPGVDTRYEMSGTYISTCTLASQFIIHKNSSLLLIMFFCS